MSRILKGLAYLFVLAVVCHVTEQMDHWGKEFLLSFPPNYNASGEIILYVTSRDAATVNVRNSLFNISSSYSLPALSSVRIKLNGSLQYSEQNITSLKAVYLNASSEVSAYVLNYGVGTSDMYTAYPLKALGTEYLLGAYAPYINAYFLVTAVQDNTTVQVHLKVAEAGKCMGGAYGNGSVLTAILRLHEVWGGACKKDFTGSVVTSDKPISVVTALDCGAVPINVKFCDHMVEMMLPVADYGSSYVLHNITYRPSSVIYRVISGYNGAVVTESTGGSKTLNKGEFVDYDLAQLDQELCITSSAPVMTLMFTKGHYADLSVPFGDPSMAVVPATEHFATDYVVNMEISTTDTFVRYVSIIINDSAAAEFSSVNNKFNPVGLGYSVAHVALNSSTQRLRHTSGYPFGAVLYAFANMTGLSLPAGLKLIDKFDYCSSSPCFNNGTCNNIPDNSTFYCSCQPGFSGVRCETNIDDCASSPCLNGATCTDAVNGFICTCAAGYTGSECQTDINDCASSPCRNGGTCGDAVNGYTCTCVLGYTGKQCETDINYCQPNPCGLLTSCTDGISSYSCCLLALSLSCTVYTVTTTPAPTTTSTTISTTVSETTSILGDTTNPPTTSSTQSTSLEGLASSTAASLTTAVKESTLPTSEPVTTDRETTDDSTTGRETTEPSSTGRETTEPSSTGQETTEPSSTGRETTEPSSTGQETTEPSSTGQETTEQRASFYTSLAATTPGTQKMQTTVTTTTEHTHTSEIPKQCACKCQRPPAVTHDDLVKENEELKKELSVDKKHLSSSIRKVTSADDHRASAMTMGYAGLVFLICSFGAILLMDFTISCRAEAKKSAPQKSLHSDT